MFNFDFLEAVLFKNNLELFKKKQRIQLHFY